MRWKIQRWDDRSRNYLKKKSCKLNDESTRRNPTTMHCRTCDYVDVPTQWHLVVFPSARSIRAILMVGRLQLSTVCACMCLCATLCVCSVDNIFFFSRQKYSLGKRCLADIRCASLISTCPLIFASKTLMIHSMQAFHISAVSLIDESISRPTEWPTGRPTGSLKIT